MAKFYGAIGYAVDEERDEHPGVIFERPVEKFYKGDILQNSRRLENSDQLNDNLTISNKIRIVADPYTISHMFAMRYVKWMGVAWKVTSVDYEAPALTLTLGGVYNGETAT